MITILYYFSICSTIFLLLSSSSHCTSIYYLASGAGIYKHNAKSAPSGVKLRESYSMGIYKGTSTAIDKIIDDMKIDFQGNDYHVINKNCNAFADEFLKRLVSNGIPGYVNRMAYIGSYFSCFMPDSLNQDPTQGNNSNNNSNNSNGLYSNSQSSQRLNKNPMYTSSNGNKLGGGTSSSSSSSSSTTTTTKNITTMGATDDAAMLRDKIRQATLSRQQKLSNK
jgi:hypothetical protein